MLNIFDDGVWCDKCKKMHPVIKWHEKYGAEDAVPAIRNRLSELIEKRPGLVGISREATKEEKNIILDELLLLNLKHHPIYESAEGDCVVCGARTVFINKETGNHVCSEECRYKDNGWKDESVYSAE